MYKDFAFIYDFFTYDVNYKKWASYIEKIFKRYKLCPQLVLDLGCGTGSLTIEMWKKGYELIGIDLSQEMLNCANQKALEMDADILFLNQDMKSFELYGTVDAVICSMDSINYITKESDLLKVFKLVNNYLNPKGLFVFDINSFYKLSEVLSDNVFYEIGEEASYIWQNSFDKDKNICTFDLTFFIKENELYRRYDEIHKQRAYTKEQIIKLLEEAGLMFIDCFSELSFDNSDEKSERIFFIAQEKDK